MAIPVGCNWSKAAIGTLSSRCSAPLNLRDSNQDPDGDPDGDPEAGYCVINIATHEALYEAHMASISDGLDARGDDRPILLMAEMSASSPARKKKTNKEPRTSSCPILSNHECMYPGTPSD